MQLMDDLHTELDTYRLNWHSLALIHAMIDAGLITTLECQRSDCLLPDVPFTKVNTRGSRTVLSLDHIVPQRHNGVHRLENLRIVHGACNYGWRGGTRFTGPHTEEAKRRIGAAQAGIPKTPEHNRKSGEGVRRHWATLTAEERSAHGANIHAATTPEARSARALKGWVTRRATRSS
jgi:hypothetical protein